MRIGYNTNGFAHHRLEDAIAILAGIGYRSVAITIDHGALAPEAADHDAQVARVKSLLDRHGLGCVIETGARFLLDPWRKHRPTLLEAGENEREQREAFLSYAIEVAGGLGAEAVSFWSGVKADELDDSTAMDLLAGACTRLCRLAEPLGVRLAFEPEPGMFIDTMGRFAELHDRVNHPLFGLTLDVGHVHCLADGDVCEHIDRWRDRLFNVHFEDMRRGVHEHLPPGEGEMDLRAILRELQEVNYAGGVHLELSRHSHDAVRTARQAFAFLTSATA